MLQAALEWARTAPVFTCRPAPDKSPLTRHGFTDASTVPREIHKMWRRNPNASIGVPTGKRSGFFAVDVDVDPSKEIDGRPHLEELERRNGKLPATRTVRSPRGGIHRYYA
ncbi:MAG: bifunctional DNA primase/polymerase, partial [Actinomycetota bacterium]|nr:bifunctional DNA primase/polymerase [Actinomycetota bacterium]